MIKVHIDLPSETINRLKTICDCYIKEEEENKIRENKKDGYFFVFLKGIILPKMRINSKNKEYPDIENLPKINYNSPNALEFWFSEEESDILSQSARLYAQKHNLDIVHLGEIPIQLFKYELLNF